MGAETMTALLNTVQGFWPGCPPPVLNRGDIPLRDGYRRFVVVPNASNPRLLVPWESTAAAAGSMRRFSTALTFGQTGGRVALALALRLGGSRLFPDFVDVPAMQGESSSLAQHLCTVLNQPVTFSVGIGSLRVNRKPVVQIFDAGGRTLAFAKVGNSSVADGDVRAEALALTTLATRRWQLIEIPQLLHSGTWNGTFVLIMTPLATSVFQSPTSRSTPPFAAMNELSTAFTGGSHRLDDTPWWSRQVAIGEELIDRNRRATFRALAARLIELGDDRKWQVGAWHGDWTSWNMVRRRGIVKVWDWERFESGVPVGLDIFHYAVNEAVRRAGIETKVILDALSSPRVLQRERDPSIRILAGVYLLTVAGRYLLAAQGHGGGAISGRAETTLEALTEWLA